jgi:hypothetical protein
MPPGLRNLKPVDYAPLLGTSHAYATYLLLKHMPSTVMSFRFISEPDPDQGARDIDLRPGGFTTRADLRRNGDRLVDRSMEQLTKVDLGMLEIGDWCGDGDTFSDYDLRSAENLSIILTRLRWSKLSSLTLTDRANPMFDDGGFPLLETFLQGDDIGLPRLKKLRLVGHSIHASFFSPPSSSDRGCSWKMFPRVRNLYLDHIVMMDEEDGCWVRAMRGLFEGMPAIEQQEREGKLRAVVEQPLYHIEEEERHSDNAQQLDGEELAALKGLLEGHGGCRAVSWR